MSNNRKHPFLSIMLVEDKTVKLFSAKDGELSASRCGSFIPGQSVDARPNPWAYWNVHLRSQIRHESLYLLSYLGSS